MTAAVRFYSKSGNTKKLADAIAEVAGCQAKEVPAAIEEPVDVLFIGASVYAAGISQEMKDYIASLDADKIGKVVVFSTSALVQRAYPQIEKELSAKGLNVAEDNFYCRGSFLHLHKGRPNAEDVEAAKSFAKKVLA